MPDVTIDNDTAFREAIVARLKATQQIANIVGERVFGPQPPSLPAFPFIRMGFPTSTPFVADCWNATLVDFTVHAFADGPGDDLANKLARLIRHTLHDAEDIAVAGAEGIISMLWQRSQVLRDTEEAGRYHAIVDFAAMLAEVVD